MQCTVCKNQDELSNLVTVKLSETENGYAHPSCVEQHNKTVAKNLHVLMEVSPTVDEIFDRDLDATDFYVVEQFLREHKRKSGKRFVHEICAAARERREQNNKTWLFERLEEEVKAWPAETSAAFIEEIVGNLGKFAPSPIDESALCYAARLLAQQVAWRKYEEELKASADDQEKWMTGDQPMF